jgi:hypothetical protein
VTGKYDRVRQQEIDAAILCQQHCHLGEARWAVSHHRG